MRITIRYFKKSTYAAAHLRDKREEMGIKQGLVSIGKTRFATVYHSGESLRVNQPAIESLCRSGEIKIKVLHLRNRYEE